MHFKYVPRKCMPIYVIKVLGSKFPYLTKPLTAEWLLNALKMYVACANLGGGSGEGEGRPLYRS